MQAYKLTHKLIAINAIMLHIAKSTLCPYAPMNSTLPYFYLILIVYLRSYMLIQMSLVSSILLICCSYVLDTKICFCIAINLTKLITNQLLISN